MTNDYRLPTKLKLIAAIPAYDEEKYIGTIVLKTRQYVDEVIVVDDGSTDSTSSVASLAGATVIRHDKNKGKGAAIQSILAEARKKNPDILILLDADFQHDPDEIPILIRPIISDGFDLAIGSREQQRGKIPRYRRIGQRVLSYFSRILSKEKVIDSECGYRALSARAIAELKLRQKGFAIETEMIAAATEKGLKITEVPISAIYTKDSWHLSGHMGDRRCSGRGWSPSRQSHDISLAGSCRSIQHIHRDNTECYISAKRLAYS